MRVIFLFLFTVFLYFPVNSSSFSEVFGSEGAAGINNPKTRLLSYTLQYLTLSGSIGYLGKQLFESGFMDPLGFVPDPMIEISPIAYKNDLYKSEINPKLLANKEKIDSLNHMHNLKKKSFDFKFSAKSIETRGKNNFLNSLSRLEQRNILTNRYINVK